MGPVDAAMASSALLSGDPEVRALQLQVAAERARLDSALSRRNVPPSAPSETAPISGRMRDPYPKPRYACYGLLFKDDLTARDRVELLDSHAIEDVMRLVHSAPALARSARPGVETMVERGRYIATFVTDERQQTTITSVKSHGSSVYPLTIEQPPPWLERGLKLHGLKIGDQLIGPGDQFFERYKKMLGQLLPDGHHITRGPDTLTLKPDGKGHASVHLDSEGHRIGEIYPLTVPWGEWKGRFHHAWAHGGG